MRVALVTPPSLRPLSRDMAGGLGFHGSNAVVLPPLDLLYIAAILREQKQTVCVIDSDPEQLTENDVLKKIFDFLPDFVISTISLPNLSYDCSFLEKVKMSGSWKVIPKTNITDPDILMNILNLTKAEYVLWSEPEKDILSILNGEQKHSMAWIENGTLKKSEPSWVENPDVLPFPTRDLINLQVYKYNLLGFPVTTIQTSRGCPYPCGYYCPYPLVQGKIWRSRSAQNVIDELKEIRFTYKISDVLFRDAVFTLDKKRTLEICNKMISENLNIRWWCETRVDRLDEELLLKMKEAGCVGINIGVETADEKILKTVAKRGVTIPMILEITRLAKRIGIQLHYLLMVGLLDETKSSIYETYKLVKKAKPDSIGITFASPYPGTELRKDAIREGLIENPDFELFDAVQPIMRSRNIGIKELTTGASLIRKRHDLNQKTGFISKLKGSICDINAKIWAS